MKTQETDADYKQIGVWDAYYVTKNYLCGECGFPTGKPEAPEYKGKRCQCKRTASLQ